MSWTPQMLQEPFADLVHQFPVGAFPEKRIDDFPHHLRPAENDEERHQQPGEAVHGKRRIVRNDEGENHK